MVTEVLLIWDCLSVCKPVSRVTTRKWCAERSKICGVSNDQWRMVIWTVFRVFGESVWISHLVWRLTVESRVWDDTVKWDWVWTDVWGILWYNNNSHADHDQNRRFSGCVQWNRWNWLCGWKVTSQRLIRLTEAKFNGWNCKTIKIPMKNGIFQTLSKQDIWTTKRKHFMHWIHS